MKKETKWVVGGYVPLVPKDQLAPTADWFAVNQKFNTKPEAVAFMNERREAYAGRGKEVKFTFREETVKVFY